MRIQLSCPFIFTHFILGCDGTDTFWRHSMLVKLLLQQETPNLFISADLCPPNSPVDPETRSTTEFGD